MAYMLSYIPNFINKLFNSNDSPNTEVESDNQYFNIVDYTTKSNEKYKIVRYRKELLAVDLIPVYGLLRSVIVNKENTVVSFAPPKSMPADKFMELYSQPTQTIIAEDSQPKQTIIAEEFIEGTMINVFFDPSVNSWKISTRNTVDADVTFYKGPNKTFRTMFFEACEANKLSFELLNPKFCYSFVLQHPENRIVVPFSVPRLYLVDVYEIYHNDKTIIVTPHDIIQVRWESDWDKTSICFPSRYLFNHYSELIEKFASPNTPYYVMGIVLKNTFTHQRAKIRNPNYEEIRQLRGNQTKTQYQYLTLRKDGRLSEFLKYYPELKPEFSTYRDQVHMFTNTLHRNYISCYVKKEKPLGEFSSQYRTHMFKLHEKFLTELREQGLFITNTMVINYVNNLHPSLLMHCINYNFRKHHIDTIKASI
jgi:hypothetical protein